MSFLSAKTERIAGGATMLAIAYNGNSRKLEPPSFNTASVLSVYAPAALGVLTLLPGKQIIPESTEKLILGGALLYYGGTRLMAGATALNTDNALFSYL